MTGSIISIILLTMAFAFLAFVVSFIIFSLVSSDKIAAEKRIEDLKKREGDVTDIALVKHQSKRHKLKKESSKGKNFFDKYAASLYKELQAADVKMRPEEFSLIWLLVTVVPAGLTVLFSGSASIALLLFVLGLMLPLMIIKMKQKARVKKFDEQLSDALIIACSCLRSGLSFTQSMETISRDMSAPISTEFAQALAEMSMGASMEEALERMNTRIKSSYLSLTVSAVLIQKQTGGNLSQILDNISSSIKEKMKLKKELNSATASGKMTGMLMGSMPVILMVLFYIVNPAFMSPLFETTTGHIFIGVAAGLEVLCFILIKKIVTIKM